MGLQSSGRFVRGAFSALLVALLVAVALWSDAASHAGGPPEEPPRARAERFLRQKAAVLGLRGDLQDLRPAGERKGRSADHVRYQQTLHGLPVFGSYITVSLPRESNREPLVLNRYRRGWENAPRTARIGSDAAVAAALADLGGELRAPATSEPAYFAGEGRPVLSWQIVLPAMPPAGTWLYLIDAGNGSILYKHNLLLYDGGHVFDPNPAKTNGGTSPALDCDSAANESALAGQYRNRSLLGINDGQHQLRGTYVDLAALGIVGGYKPAGQASEPSRNYVYPCTDDRFEETMVYRHIDMAQRKLQSLGFVGESAIVDRPIPAHAHYFADCNAFFDPYDRGLHFGDGHPSFCGSSIADTAEDADVIVHEYGHALQDDQVPGWAFGPYPLAEQSASIGEGFSDFFAAAIFGDPCLGEYVNFGQFACGGSRGLRWLQNSRLYPGGFEACPDVDFTGDGFPESEEPHCGGEIWGGVLWDLVENLPGGVTPANRDRVLTLAVDAHFYLDPVTTFDEAAGAMICANQGIYGGADAVTISGIFAARGISAPGCAFSDFDYGYIRIRHSFAGDLDVNIKAGPNPASPLCTIDVLNPNFNAGFADYVSYVNLGTCSGHLPPNPGRPWWLEVRDAFSFDTGSIVDWEISMHNSACPAPVPCTGPNHFRCVAADTPVPIPDNNGFVYSKVDCTTYVLSCDDADHDNDGFNNCSDPDDDNDAFSDATEAVVGTSPLAACGLNAWPADIDNDGFSDVTDITFLTGNFGASVPPAPARYDIGEPQDRFVDITDITRLLAFFGQACS